MLDKVEPREAQAVREAFGSNASREAITLNRRYLDLGVSTVDPQEGPHNFAVQTAMIKEVYGLLVVLLDYLEADVSAVAHEAIVAQAVVLTSLAVCIVVAVITASTAARAVTKPFMKLYKTSENLNKESKNIHEHATATGRFVPYKILNLMGVGNIVDLKVGQLVLKRLTIMMGDVVSFTTLSSKLVPDDVFRYINSWLAVVVPHIETHGGAVDKFLGDGFLAFFHKAEMAVAAGIDIFTAAREANRALAVSGQHLLRFGLACHSGDVCIGAIGNKDRMNTLTISEAVRTTNSVEARTRTHKANMLITEPTLELLTSGMRDQFRKVDFFAGVPGMWLYECLSACWTAEEGAAKTDTRETFQSAVEHFHRNMMDVALAQLRQVLHKHPEDAAAQHMLMKTGRHATSARASLVQAPISVRSHARSYYPDKPQPSEELEVNSFCGSDSDSPLDDDSGGESSPSATGPGLAGPGRRRRRRVPPGE